MGLCSDDVHAVRGSAFQLSCRTTRVARRGTGRLRTCRGFAAAIGVWIALGHGVGAPAAAAQSSVPQVTAAQVLVPQASGRVDSSGASSSAGVPRAFRDASPVSDLQTEIDAAASSPRRADLLSVYQPPYPLGAVASLLAGPIVPGVGHYVAGETTEAHQLLILGGAGVGLSLTGIAGLAVTGASRYTVVPFGTFLAAGVSAISVAWLSDLFATTMPVRFRARPHPYVPRQLDVSVGVEPQYVPGQRATLYGVAAIDYRSHPLRYGLDTRVATLGRGHRLGAESGLQFYRTGASFGEIALRAEWGQATGSRVRATTLEAVVRGRLHLGDWLNTLHGSFVDWGWGLALANYRYSTGQRNWHDMLRLEAGWGLWLAPLGSGDVTEWKIYYTHRRDDLSGGLLVPGIGAGNLGAVGSRFSFWVTPQWGGTLDITLGASLSGRVTLDYRWGTSR